MKYLAENLKAQNEENKNMLAKMLKDKENSVQNDNKKLLQRVKEVNEKNNELIINNNIYNNKIKTLEEQLSKVNTYKGIIHNLKAYKCKYCENLYLYEDFKSNYSNCQKGLINVANSNMNFNPDKLKIKIL